jgi:hypothetical protein
MIWRLFMFKKLLPLLFLFAGFQVNAGIIYNVDLDHGAGSVFGTIETDGTIGVLFLANVINVNLSMQSSLIGGGNLQSFTTFQTAGSLFTASSSDLSFDFNGNNNGAYSLAWFQDTVTGTNNYWCLNGSGGGCDNNKSASSIGYSTGQVSTITGLSKIASTTVTVPEPSIIALFALGLVGIGFARRRQS